VTTSTICWSVASPGCTRAIYFSGYCAHNASNTRRATRRPGFPCHLSAPHPGSSLSAIPPKCPQFAADRRFSWPVRGWRGLSFIVQAQWIAAYLELPDNMIGNRIAFLLSQPLPLTRARFCVRGASISAIRREAAAVAKPPSLPMRQRGRAAARASSRRSFPTTASSLRTLTFIVYSTGKDGATQHMARERAQCSSRLAGRRRDRVPLPLVAEMQERHEHKREGGKGRR
jgi:hypothetical protein